MKRFFSLMLVALLLVSALPFAASAAVTECKYCGNNNLKVVDDPAYTVKGDCVTDSVVVYQCQNTACNGNTFTHGAPQLASGTRGPASSSRKKSLPGSVGM